MLLKIQAVAGIIFTPFDLSKENFLYIDCEEEELVLLLIDIHAFRGCEQIPKEALEYFSSILTFFEQHDKGIILRIVYDTKGRGMEKRAIIN